MEEIQEVQENQEVQKTQEIVIGEIEAAIEAILFAAGYPISYAKLSEVLGVGVRDVKKIISLMAEKYNSNDGHSGITLLIFEDTCQFCTREKYAPYIREALGIRRGGNLSASSMEVLAIVAYNQPVTRAFIDTVRGVDSAYAVNSLIDKELIAPCGRLDAPGRPMLYKTTENFLRVFGINTLAELPEVQKIQLTDEQLTAAVDVKSEESTNNDESTDEEEVN